MNEINYDIGLSHIYEFENGNVFEEINASSKQKC